MENSHHHRTFGWTVLSIPFFKSFFLIKSSCLKDESVFSVHGYFLESLLSQYGLRQHSHVLISLIKGKDAHN